MIDINELYSKTNSGLDIIRLYFPDAEPGKKFKMRPEERTPSANVWRSKDGIYHVNDFGARDYDPVNLCMNMENLPFTQALYKLAGIFHVSNIVTADTAKPRIETAATSEPDHQPVCELADGFTPEQLNFWLPGMKAETLQTYGWSAVKSYTFVRHGKKITVHSTDTYPIFVRDCGGFQKLYKPFDFTSRFQYIGPVPPDNVNGLEQLRQKHAAYVKAQTLTDEDKLSRFDPDKVQLEECVICSGERDSMTAAMLGYSPIWLNSECATLPSKVLKELRRMCKRIYNIPDLDATGVERGEQLAITYPEIYTVELPSWLKDYSDAKGKRRKDFRDYAELRDKSLAFDFKNLLIAAKCCKFWERVETDKGARLQLNTAYLYQFLKMSGFRKMKYSSNDVRYVRITDNIIKEVMPSDIRDYILNWVRGRFLGNEIENLILNKATTKGTFADDLDLIEPNMNNYTYKSQLFRFQNATVEITADKITPYRKFSDCYFFEKSVIPHRFAYTSPAFTCDGTNLTVEHLNSNVFKYLINASRLYWRKELETGDPEADQEYYEENRFNIAGPRLNDKQIQEQTQNLINKLYAIGYLLFRYKDSSNAVAIWSMENKITDERQSSGGSGKSIVFEKILAKFLPVCSFDGRNPQQTNDTHILGAVNKYHAFLLLNDFSGTRTDFEKFYNAITDNMNKRGLYKEMEELTFAESPKLVFTSNFPPPIMMNDSSSFRRLLFMVYSDYYHHKTNDNSYNETRQISDDFDGRNLWEAEYQPEEYRNDLNFFLDCVQFYLNMRNKRIKCNAPLDNVIKRIRRLSIGDSFIEWADSFFCEGSQHLDAFVPINDAKNAYMDYSGVTRISSQSLKNKLKDWCAQTDYVESVNRPDLCDNDGQIRHNNQTCIYVCTKKKPDTQSKPEPKPVTKDMFDDDKEPF